MRISQDYNQEDTRYCLVIDDRSREKLVSLMKKKESNIAVLICADAHSHFLNVLRKGRVCIGENKFPIPVIRYIFLV